MKTIYDYHRLFGIQTGLYYHGLDYACQVCLKSFELYEESKTDEEREMNWTLAETTAKYLNPPIPIRWR